MPWVIDEKTGQRTWKPETPQVEGITPPEAEKKYIATEGGVQKAKAPASGRYQRAGFVGAGQRTELREKEKSRMLALQNLATKGRMFTQRFSNMFQDVPKMSEEDEQIFKVETPGALTGEKFIEMAKEPLYGTEAKERFTSQRETEAKEAGNIVTDIETGFGTEKTEQERQYKAYLKSIGEAPDEVSLEGLSGARRLGALREIARKGVIGETGALGELEKIANIGQGEIDQLDQRSIDRINELKTNLKTDLKTQYGETLGVLGGTAKQSFDNLVDRLSDYTEGLGDINQIGTELTNQDSLISTLFTDIKTQQGLTGGYEGVLDTLAKVNAGRDFEIANINKDIAEVSENLQTKNEERVELQSEVSNLSSQQSKLNAALDEDRQPYKYRLSQKIHWKLDGIGDDIFEKNKTSFYDELSPKLPSGYVVGVVPTQETDEGYWMWDDPSTKAKMKVQFSDGSSTNISLGDYEAAKNRFVTRYADEYKQRAKKVVTDLGYVSDINLEDLEFKDQSLYKAFGTGRGNSLSSNISEKHRVLLRADLEDVNTRVAEIVKDTPTTISEMTANTTERDAFVKEKSGYIDDIATITSAIEKFATDLEAKKTTKTGLGTERTSIQDTLAKIARGEEGVTYADRSIEDILAGK